MAYKTEEIEKIFNEIMSEVESGCSLTSILKRDDTPCGKTFYEWVDADEEKVKRYARAREARAELIFEEILDIADQTQFDTIKKEDGFEQPNHEWIARSRLKIDARKWMLGKMDSKKYGDKSTTILEGGDKPIEISFED